MSSLQELNVRQISEALAAAAQRQLPAALTVQMDGQWMTYHSRVLAANDRMVILEQPPLQAGETPHEFVPGEKLGVSFKLKHYKHLFTVEMTGRVEHRLTNDFSVGAIAVVQPDHMQRLQRRAFFRAPIPPNRIVRASFWLGGGDSHPSGGQTSMPVWSGQVTNISAGGFQLTTTADVASAIEIGDTVGVRLVFGAAADQAVYVDAQFRHLQQDPGQTILGFQFIGLGQTAEGRQALRLISLKVSEFQQACQDLESLSQKSE